MKLRTILIGEDTHNERPCVATIGFFDGVHRGHAYLIQHVVETAHRAGMEAMVITFSKHPRRVLRSEFQPGMLCTFDEKLMLLANTGIDCCAVLDFSESAASLSAHDFMEKVLRDRLNVKQLIIGYDNRFGHNREEGFDDYVRYGHELGIDVSGNDAFILNDVNISSSVIRALLAEGEVDMASRCLGYHYFLSGRVVHGMREGRKMGFPTANMEVAEDLKLIPASGVYAVRVHVDGVGGTMNGIMNIGVRPTFGGDKISLEVNILDFNGDIYGRIIDVSFVSRMRDERKFGSPDELASQLAKDRMDAVKILERKPVEGINDYQNN